MGVWILALEMLIILAITTGLLHKYGDWRRQHVVVSAATLVSWYFSFSIVAILPIDVVQTTYRQCLQDNNGSSIHSNISTNASLQRSMRSLSDGVGSSSTPASTVPSGNSSTTTAAPTTTVAPSHPCETPITDVDVQVIKAMWLVVYWSSFCLTWVILPFMQTYSMSGEFTVLGKIKRSLIENAIFYGSYIAILLALFIYLLVQGVFEFNKESIKTLVTTASNTWGLFFMVLLMGYGLVEVPRYVWDLSRREHRLRRTYFQVAKLHSEKSDATESLEDVLDDIKYAHAQIPSSSFFYPKLCVIISKCPTNFQDRLKLRPGGAIASSRGGASRNRGDDLTGGEFASEAKLVSMHKKLLVARQNLWRLEAKWEALLKKAFKLEDIVKSKSSGTCEYRRYSQGTHVRSSVCNPRLEFYWKCVISPKVYQASGILLAFLSLTLVWSEVTFFQKDPTLSIYALFITEVFASGRDYFLIQATCVFLLLYMCVTVYWTVFRVRFFNFYYLSPHHHTDEYTLLFSGLLLCRLTPSVCLNFLGLSHMDSHISKESGQLATSFTEVMGHMDIVSFISDGFNVYFPLVLVVLCLMTLFNVGSHLLSFIGFQQFIGEGDLTSELVDEGQQLIKREHRRIERENRGEQRRKEWDERLNRSGRGADGFGEDPDLDDKQPQSVRGGGAYRGKPNSRTDEIRAKYSRRPESGVPSRGGYPGNTSAAQSNGKNNVNATAHNTNDSISDHSGTDLLDSDYIDFQDFRDQELQRERDQRSSTDKFNKPPPSLFDGI